MRKILRGGAAIIVAGTLASLNGTGAAAQNGEFSDWLVKLRAEAKQKGIGEATLNTALNGLTPINRVIELDRHQPEFKLTFQQYMNRVVPNSRVIKGRKKLAENKELLTAIGKQYGVQPRFIVAFWGVETDFGRVDGGFSVVRALATLAHDGRRSKFFRGELIRSLRIIDQGHITAANMKGSWAGAMGQFQFMPSTFESFAIDQDGDGKRDIWRNKVDAFASAANFLSKSGWNPDQTWGRQVKLPEGFDKSLIGLKTKKSLSEWQALGIRRADGSPLPTRNLSASVVTATKDSGPAFLAYNNYRVTLRWNRSTFFAVAIGTLAEKIGGR
ncbi:MAG: lytic murein transglycosylase [Proteobacteria bacterium]|nr:lytic murein transglycosylase [Pseudomonadota bacterium]